MVLTVGVVGAGAVGQALGNRLLKTGHKVLYGSRDPTSAKAKEILQKQPAAQVDSVHNVTSAADVILLTTPGSPNAEGIQAVAASLGPGVSKKVVIDATNPLTGWPGLEIMWDQGTSGGEVLQAALPDSYVFKAFNTIGVEILGNAEALGQKLNMFFAGPKEQKDVAVQVIADVGFDPTFVGPIRYSRNLEAIAELWIHLGVPGLKGGAENWGRDFAFGVHRKV